MKYCVFFLFLLAVIGCKKNNNTDAQNNQPIDTLYSWKRIQTDKRFMDVWGEKNNLLICADSSLYKSSNEGQTLVKVNNLVASFYNIQFLSPLNGFSNSGQNLAYTNDGGLNWTKRAFATNDSVFKSPNEIFFVNNSTGYLSFSNGLRKTIDTGKTWLTSFTGNIKGLFFSSESIGYLFRDNDKRIYKTNTSGNIWYPLSLVSEYSNGSSAFTVLQFINTSGWLNDQNKLFKTTDGGVTWSVIFTTSNSTIRDFQFVNDLTGYVATDNEIYKTTDGGKTFVRNCKISSGFFIEIYFENENSGWACGDKVFLRLKE